MLQQIMKSVIEERTTEQLYEMFDGLVGAASLQSLQGMGTNQTLDEMIVEIAAEMNARRARGGY